MHRLFIPIALVLTGALGVFAVTAPGIEAGGGGHGCTTTPRDGANEPVVIRDNCFEPALLRVEAGDTVEWRQQDSVYHNVALFDGELVGGEDTLAAGDTVTRVFDTPGVYGYYCSVHPGMIGVIAVGVPASGEVALQTSGGDDTTAETHAASVAPISGDGMNLLPALGIALTIGLVSVAGGFVLTRRTR